MPPGLPFGMHHPLGMGMPPPGFIPPLPMNEIPYDYCNLDEETMSRILILENLGPAITK